MPHHGFTVGECVSGVETFEKVMGVRFVGFVVVIPSSRFDSSGRHTLTVTQPEGGAADLASVSLTPVTME